MGQAGRAAQGTLDEVGSADPYSAHPLCHALRHAHSHVRACQSRPRKARTQPQSTERPFFPQNRQHCLPKTVEDARGVSDAGWSRSPSRSDAWSPRAARLDGIIIKVTRLGAVTPRWSPPRCCCCCCSRLLRRNQSMWLLRHPALSGLCAEKSFSCSLFSFRLTYRMYAMWAHCRGTDVSL